MTYRVVNGGRSYICGSEEKSEKLVKNRIFAFATGVIVDEVGDCGKGNNNAKINMTKIKERTSTNGLIRWKESAAQKELELNNNISLIINANHASSMNDKSDNAFDTRVIVSIARSTCAQKTDKRNHPLYNEGITFKHVPILQEIPDLMKEEDAFEYLAYLYVRHAALNFLIPHFGTNESKLTPPSIKRDTNIYIRHCNKERSANINKNNNKKNNKKYDKEENDELDLLVSKVDFELIQDFIRDVLSNKEKVTEYTGMKIRKKYEEYIVTRKLERIAANQQKYNIKFITLLKQQIKQHQNLTMIHKDKHRTHTGHTIYQIENAKPDDNEEEADDNEEKTDFNSENINEKRGKKRRRDDSDDILEKETISTSNLPKKRKQYELKHIPVFMSLESNTCPAIESIYDQPLYISMNNINCSLIFSGIQNELYYSCKLRKDVIFIQCVINENIQITFKDLSVQETFNEANNNFVNPRNKELIGVLKINEIHEKDACLQKLFIKNEKISNINATSNFYSVEECYLFKNNLDHKIKETEIMSVVDGKLVDKIKKGVSIYQIKMIKQKKKIISSINIKVKEIEKGIKYYSKLIKVESGIAIEKDKMLKYHIESLDCIKDKVKLSKEEWEQIKNDNYVIIDLKLATKFFSGLVSTNIDTIIYNEQTNDVLCQCYFTQIIMSLDDNHKFKDITLYQGQ